MIRVLVGHVLDRLAELPAESVHCVVTSPPYYGLRDYGIEPQVWQDGWRGSLGMEPTPSLYIEHMVAVFREVRRVLRKDGALWLNIGDSYAAHGNGGGSVFDKGRTDGRVSYAGDAVRGREATKRARVPPGLKPKDLLGIPWALAFALRDDGWWLRSEITWAKRAPMPESCTDRPTTATEKVFLLSRSKAYYYDAEAVKEEASETSHGSPNINPGEKNLAIGKAGAATTLGKWEPGKDTKRNMRNFWLLGPEPFPEAHFATFPTEVPRRAILAGSKLGDTVLDPFLGAGTTALVADRLGRHCIGIELNKSYAAMAERRCREEVPLFAEIAAE